MAIGDSNTTTRENIEALVDSVTPLVAKLQPTDSATTPEPLAADPIVIAHAIHVNTSKHSFVVYEIEYRGNTVHRRYSEFVQLQKTLKKEFKGWDGHLPSKNVDGMAQKVIDKRKAELQTWLEQAVAHPDASALPAFQIFTGLLSSESNELPIVPESAPVSTDMDLAAGFKQHFNGSTATAPQISAAMDAKMKPVLDQTSQRLAERRAGHQALLEQRNSAIAERKQLQCTAESDLAELAQQQAAAEQLASMLSGHQEGLTALRSDLSVSDEQSSARSAAQRELADRLEAELAEVDARLVAQQEKHAAVVQALADLDQAHSSQLARGLAELRALEHKQVAGSKLQAGTISYRDTLAEQLTALQRTLAVQRAVLDDKRALQEEGSQDAAHISSKVDEEWAAIQALQAEEDALAKVKGEAKAVLDAKLAELSKQELLAQRALALAEEHQAALERSADQPGTAMHALLGEEQACVAEQLAAAHKLLEALQQSRDEATNEHLAVADNANGQLSDLRAKLSAARTALAKVSEYRGKAQAHAAMLVAAVAQCEQQLQQDEQCAAMLQAEVNSVDERIQKQLQAEAERMAAAHRTLTEAVEHMRRDHATKHTVLQQKVEAEEKVLAELTNYHTKVSRERAGALAGGQTPLAQVQEELRDKLQIGSTRLEGHMQAAAKSAQDISIVRERLAKEELRLESHISRLDEKIRVSEDALKHLEDYERNISRAC